MKPSELSGYWFREGIHFIQANPERALALLIKKSAMFWNYFEIPDNYNYYFYKKEVPVLKILFLGFGMVAPLGLLGFILARKQPGTWLFVLFVFGYMASIVPFHMASRYRLPIVPPLIIFAGYTVFWIIQKIREKDHRPLLYAIFPLGMFFTLVHWSVVDDSTTFQAPYTELGIIAGEKGDYEEATNYFKKALEIDPGYASAHYNLGNILVKTAQLEDAVTAYEKDLKNDPEFLMAYDNLGKVFLRLGKLDEALKTFHQALDLRPDFAEASTGAGLVYHMQGRYDKAIDAHIQAISSNPRYASGYYNLACAYGKKGDNHNARQALEKAIALNPAYEEKARKDGDLESLY